jgi:hypothetical protein
LIDENGVESKEPHRETFKQQANVDALRSAEDALFHMPDVCNNWAGGVEMVVHERSNSRDEGRYTGRGLWQLLTRSARVLAP